MIIHEGDNGKWRFLPSATVHVPLKLMRTQMPTLSYLSLLDLAPVSAYQTRSAVEGHGHFN